MTRSFLIGISLFSILAPAYQSSDKPSPIIHRAKKRPAAAAAPNSTPIAPNGAETGTAVFYLPKEDAAPVTDADLRAAHPSYPLGARLKVTNLGNNKSVLVVVGDRIGETPGVVISVSRQAAEELGFVKEGTAQVRVEPVASTKEPAKK